MTVGSPPASRTTGAGPVVICCAPAELRELEEVVRELEAAGNAVELCPEAAADPKALGPVIDRCHGEGLYVLCRSHGLERETIDTLRDILLAHHVPFGRTLTVASRRPRELLERITAGLKRVTVSRQRRMTRVPPEGPTVPRRPTVLGMPVPKPAASPRAKPPPPPPKTQPDDAQAAQPPAETPHRADRKRAAKPKGPIPFDEQTTIEVDHDWVAQEEREYADLARRARAEAESKPPPRPEPDPEDSLAGVSLITAADLADLTDDDDGDSGSESRDSGSEDGSIELSASDMLVASQPRVPPPPRTKVLITGDTVVTNALTDAVLEQPPPSSPPAASALAPEPTAPPVPDPNPVDGAAPGLPMPAPISSEGRDRRRIGLWAAVGGISLIGVVMIAFAIGGDGTTSDTTPEDGKSDREAKARDDDAPKDEPEIEPPPEPDATLPGQMRTAVMDALRTRKVRALDVLLVASKQGPRMAYADAQSFCRTLEVEGLEGWRLPEVGELSSLADAKMLGSGVYWSDTPADTFGDKRLAWYARRDRVVEATRDSEVVCVRGERAAQ